MNRTPNDNKLTNWFHLPHADDIRAMLKLACQMHELPELKRAGHLLEGLSGLLGASMAFAWRLDEAGRATGGIARPAGKGAVSIDQDPAAALLARTQRRRTPVVRFRHELIEPELWKRTAHPILRHAADTIYSLHFLADDARSLVSFHRDADANVSWGEREAGIVHLMHSQSAWALDASHRDEQDR